MIFVKGKAGGNYRMKFTDLILKYDLFLFDLDGLLVDTEALHYKAYQKMCLDRGLTLSWDFKTYCSKAHVGSEFLKKGVYEELPELYRQEPNWGVLHAEKQKAFLSVLAKEGVALMPGVEKVLRFLFSHQKKCCVVTHSPSALTEEIKKAHSVLSSIPHWVTREMYENPKPSPDAYQMALKLHSSSCDQVIGFEDTLRGFNALTAAGIEAIVISSLLTEDMISILKEKKAVYYPSFEELI